jgi:ribosome-binding protein aMBF1 (putative translation factor)
MRPPWVLSRRGAPYAKRKGNELPPLPKPDEEGNVPALAYVRASVARDIIRERKALGLTQEQLAKLSGVRQETICRLETGLHSPTVRTVEKIERALKRAARNRDPPMAESGQTVVSERG